MLYKGKDSKIVAWNQRNYTSMYILKYKFFYGWCKISECEIDGIYMDEYESEQADIYT